MKKDTTKLKEYFEWDSETWGKSLSIWENHLSGREGQLALEIGGRRGGLSLLLAKEFKLNVICSDLNNPSNNCILNHSAQRLESTIIYDAVNCININYPDNHFDVLIFKSVIGALGNREDQLKAFQEFHRVLKSGGVLLFAENMRATGVHMYLRKKFNKWSSYWHYPTYQDFKFYLKDFKKLEYKTAGFVSLFFKSGILQKLALKFDSVIEPILNEENHYVFYCSAKK